MFLFFLKLALISEKYFPIAGLVTFFATVDLTAFGVAFRVFFLVSFANTLFASAIVEVFYIPSNNISRGIFKWFS